MHLFLVGCCLHEDDVTAAVPPRLPPPGGRPLWSRAMTGPPVRV
ncbi:MAG: hypothetical protein AVDCRST_MAG48-3701 [uncultured Friedmanniella sp.]|uniref:Uncharacterized protein n=1 Tax=uncultured Friedmanniella sp. TaxID=335381 RepID=A0A6J4LZ90_9ACTN|nr:MAG: hypothetical protein AVDCRST_MAG48-3701 [uncultured Friedmanniella sp.]